MTIAFHDVVGTIGVVMIVGAFFMLQIERVDSSSALYSLFNAVGAGLILFSLYFEFNLASFLLEAFWLVSSFIGLARRWSKGKG